MYTPSCRRRFSSVLLTAKEAPALSPVFPFPVFVRVADTVQPFFFRGADRTGLPWPHTEQKPERSQRETKKSQNGLAQIILLKVSGLPPGNMARAFSGFPEIMPETNGQTVSALIRVPACFEDITVSKGQH